MGIGSHTPTSSQGMYYTVRCQQPLDVGPCFLRHGTAADRDTACIHVRAGVDRNTPPQAPAAVLVRPGAPVPTAPTTPESMAPTSRLKTVVASVARTMTSVWRSLCSVVKGRGGAQAQGRELLVAGSGPEGGRT